MSLEAPPPSRHVSSTPIKLSAASRMLDTYLTNSEAHPHLHPDALITPTGVTFSSSGGPTGGVVMHNLRRVAAGLRGEYLEPEATPEPEENGDEAASKYQKKGNKRKNFSSEENGEGWQDKAEWEREEGGLEVGELGQRSNFVQDGGEEPEVQVIGDEQEDGAKKRKTDDGKLDKAARKQAKKDRELQRKRDLAKASAGKA